MSNITRDEWLAALADVAPLPEIDNGALTASEFCALVGIRRSAAKERLAALVKAGKARRVMKQIRDVCGRSQLVPAYVLVKETPDVLSRLEAPDARRLRRTRSRPRT